MSKSNTNRLRLATSDTHWDEIDKRINHSVANLTGTSENAEMLLLLVDLMTNDRYDPLDRSLVIQQVQQQALTYTEGFDDLLASTIEKINPKAQKPIRITA